MVCDKDLDDLLNQCYRYALSLTQSEDDAFDLVQNSYLKLVEIKPEIFLQKPDEFKNKVLFLKINNTNCHKQPCEK